MLLQVEHHTIFDYSSPIYETATEVRLHPSTGSGCRQQCINFRLDIEPDAPIDTYTDFYGNRVHHFSQLQSHDRIGILATSTVQTGTTPPKNRPLDELQRFDFLNQSRYVHIDDSIREFTTSLDRQAGSRSLGEALCRKINETFTYEPGATDVHSTSSVVMALGRGVCQDFAHVMIAAGRHLGLPTRYVSGYLFGGGSTPEGQDEASHAWCEVYCGDQEGWIGMDPTHATLLVDERYIKIGTGRDYADIPPVRGTWKGQADEKLSVSVRITALE